ncbi:MAG: hypothetical protein EPO23_02580 [Xanthobacteraceae bacterium]|nr:MAG: hypothetical protein EPO23_02580 [Xanthobacteraceae bacterium]
MFKALSAVAVAAILTACLTFLPAMTPKVEAGTPVAAAKADRLDIRPIGTNCSQQAWPRFEASCLRKAGNKTVVREARMVFSDRF